VVEMDKRNARIMYKSAKTKDCLLIEAVLPGMFERNTCYSLLGGSISQIFRNLDTRSIVIVGHVDRVKWTIETNNELQETFPVEILELKLPLEYNLLDMALIEKFSKGRVLFTFPVK
jgi:hypothetical protein